MKVNEDVGEKMAEGGWYAGDITRTGVYLVPD